MTISIHALLAESDHRRVNLFRFETIISIHALLAESDAVTTLGAGSVRDFYPRSPCGERLIQAMGRSLARLFLSTLSLRRATLSGALCCLIIKNFYPRSPCGERQLTA